MASAVLIIIGIVIILFSVFNGPLYFIKVKDVNGRTIKVPKKVLIFHNKKVAKIKFLKKINIINMIWKAIQKKIPEALKSLFGILSCFILPCLGALLFTLGIRGGNEEGEDEDEDE